MAGIQLRVTPSELQRKAGEISGLLSNVRNEYESLKNIASASKAYWTGDAANTFRSYVQGIDSDMQRVLNRLSEHPEDLLKMAGIYQDNEENIVSMASKLPVDVIK